jgi:hypothetical protein
MHRARERIFEPAFWIPGCTTLSPRSEESLFDLRVSPPHQPALSKLSVRSVRSALKIL